MKGVVFFMNMEFIIFFLFMSIISFCMAFIAYGVIIKFMGTKSDASRYTQMFLIPIVVIGFDLITLGVPIEYRYGVGSIPLGILGLFLVYYHFVLGGADSNAVAPVEVAQKQQSAKSIKHAQKKRAKAERIESIKHKK